MRDPNRRKMLIGVAAAAGVAGVGGGLLWQRHRDERAAHDEHAEHRAPAPAPDPAFPNSLRLPGAEGMYGVHRLALGPHLRGQERAARAACRASRGPCSPTRSNTGGRRISTLCSGPAPARHSARGCGMPSRKPASSTGTASRWTATTTGIRTTRLAPARPTTICIPSPTVRRPTGITPHPHHLTGKQVYLGLAGLFIVEDEEELALQQALDLRFGVTDVPLILQDKRLDESGQPRILAGRSTAVSRLPRQ